MESVRVKNYKSILDSEEIEIKPLTVLVGKNSAGKSSFIRLFPLLKQTLEKKVDGSLLWYGDYVDFGDFDTTISRNLPDNSNIEMSFKFMTYPRILRFLSFKLVSPFITKLSFKINKKKISEYCIELFDQTIAMKIDSNDRTKIFLNGMEYTIDDKVIAQRMSGDILPILVFDDEKSNYIYDYEELSFSIRNKIIDELGVLRTSQRQEIKPIKSFSKESILSLIQTLNKEKYGDYTIDSPQFMEVNNHILMSVLSYIFETINYTFYNEFSNTSYLKPIRAAVSRYYRVQGISVNEVDSDGSNLPMLLNNMTPKQLIEFEKWSKEKFGIVFSIDSRVIGHLSLIIRNDVGSDEFTNVADAGYGYSQMLPIVVLLWNIHNKKTIRVKDNSRIIIIEQPELHLHPGFQSKMLDVFANVINECKKNRIDLKIVFETHSETMINRIGYLIYKKRVLRDDVNILVFDKKDGKTNILKTNFSDDGILENWPVDFLSVED